MQENTNDVKQLVINIKVDSQIYTPKRLTELVESDLESVSRLIRIDSSNGDKTTKVSVTLHPNDFMGKITQNLTEIIKNIRQNKKYKEFLQNLQNYDTYLGNWKLEPTGEVCLRNQVGEFMQDYYTVIKDSYKLTPEQICSKDKKRGSKNPVCLRAAGYYLLKQEFPGLGSEKIGKIFNKDHSTVITALKKFKELSLNQDMELENKIKYLSEYYCK